MLELDLMTEIRNRGSAAGPHDHLVAEVNTGRGERLAAHQREQHGPVAGDTVFAGQAARQVRAVRQSRSGGSSHAPTAALVLPAPPSEHTAVADSDLHVEHARVGVQRIATLGGASAFAVLAISCDLLESRNEDLRHARIYCAARAVKSRTTVCLTSGLKIRRSRSVAKT